MVELTVNPMPGAISQAFKKIREMVNSGSLGDTSTVRIVLHPGEYNEILSYNLSNPLILESSCPDNPEQTVLRAENCEAFHKDTENRSVFVIGMAATSVTLRGFTIENTHVKTADDLALGNQAEALCWHNYNGVLDCHKMYFISRQDTVHVKGVSRFTDCYITGDVDFIWGYCDVSLWQNCHIHTRLDNRGGERSAYVLQSRALNGKKGFVFKDCVFTADKRSGKSPIYVGRSEGTGKADSKDRWDSIALINCTLDDNYDKSLWYDEAPKGPVWPEKGSSLTGWREYGTKVDDGSGKIKPCDTSKRSIHNYILTDSEYEMYYKDASSILGEYSQKYKN